MYSGSCLRIRFDRLLELLHVVGEGDQVVVRRGLDLRELRLVLPSLPHAADDEEDDASCDEQARSGRFRPRPGRRRRCLRRHSSRRSGPVATRSTKSSSVAVTPWPRWASSDSVARRPATPFGRTVASRAEVPADHGRVRSPASERVVERLEDAVGTAAGFQLRGAGRIAM